MTLLDHEPRVVVVGYGRWGRYCHCYLVGETPGLVLHGVVSGEAQKRQEITRRHGCRTYGDLQEALQDPQVDLVVLATPNSVHADQAVAALDAGKHVLTDKVMCLSVAECDRMIKAAHAADRLLTVFQNRRLDGDFNTVRALIREGELGDVRWIETAWQGFGVWRRWRGQADMGGGKIYDLGPHMIDQILLLFPEPVAAVYCRTHYDDPTADVESEGLIVMEFESGRTALVDVSSLALIEKPRFYVRGTKGTFRKYGLDPQEKAMMEGDIDAATEPEALCGTLRTQTDERSVQTQPGRWKTFYENLRDVLTNGTAPMVSLEEERRLMCVIEAAKASAAQGRVVRLVSPTQETG